MVNIVMLLTIFLDGESKNGKLAANPNKVEKTEKNKKAFSMIMLNIALIISVRLNIKIANRKSTQIMNNFIYGIILGKFLAMAGFLYGAAHIGAYIGAYWAAYMGAEIIFT